MIRRTGGIAELDYRVAAAQRTTYERSGLPALIPKG